MIYQSDSVEQTYKIAAEVAGELLGGERIVLNGQLGAGKTTFTKGLALALGITKTVTSPSFTLLKSYQGRLKLHHFDMYRLEDISEVLELGFDEVLSDNTAVAVIEWNKFPNLQNVITVNITNSGENSRIIEILRQQ